MSGAKMSPSYLFEVSWEVCNKVGGIHTVVSTKALTATKKYGDRYMTIAPDIARKGGDGSFEEDANLLAAWRKALYAKGIRVRVGHWKTEGRPIVIMVDFTYLFSRKDEILKTLWDSYGVDSLSGGWDYVESILFGYASGVVIESFVDFFAVPTDKVVAHFHEWMTVSGGLYLRRFSPYVATLFTTHATVMGRCIAGNGLPLYSNLDSFNSDELARQFNVMAKHSIEKVAAELHDAFLTVSDITAAECRAFLGREVDCVTPNGFEDDFVWKGEEFEKKRTDGRANLIKVAEAAFATTFDSAPLIVATSGRYEYRNKGIDILLESLKTLAQKEDLSRDIVAFIMVPVGNTGVNEELRERVRTGQPTSKKPIFVTHNIEGVEWNQVMNSIKGSPLDSESSRVKVIFVPSYLDGKDGLFNKSYYELLVGVDITVFPSYYEPWGYTPLESAAFRVPTITTSLSGFGLWVDRLDEHGGVSVIARDDYNDNEIIEQIASAIESFGVGEVEALRDSAYNIAQTALWESLFDKYEEAYSIAIAQSVERTSRVVLPEQGEPSQGFERHAVPHTAIEQPNWNRMIIERHLPERLMALESLSRNLWWCWNSGARDLFEYIDRELWERVERNPIALLDKLAWQRVAELEQDEHFLKMLDGVNANFGEYMSRDVDPSKPTVAYFSMEFGLHSSLKIYSGGLGILAGDYLKEASDRGVPMVAVGLLYRYGYFTQRLSAQGDQEANYEPQHFSKLPLAPVRDAEGNWLTVEISFPGRQLYAHVWCCDVGRTKLYLLDSDYEANLPEDRAVTHHLYGGDWENRLKQEILLGIGGIKLLRALGVEQQVYHCNEGHAAFIGVERLRHLIAHHSLKFDEALEVVRSSSLFTTHTPVPAGHDAFEESIMRQYMAHYPQELGIDWDSYMALGRSDADNAQEKFSMSNLACRLSQEVNGVSWLHGEVSKEILAHLWPGYFKSELHIGYVTNGVHFPTWISSSMKRLYERYFADGFSGATYNIEAWQKVHDIPDAELWAERIFLKDKLISHIKARYSDMSKVRVSTPSQIVKITEELNPETLTIGFARRFATYKRAHLLFTDLDRLSQIVNNKERPVQFIFAGKAHPNDKPGQDLIKRIVEVSSLPQFVGKIIFLQNYDMEIARRMVQGVDVWLNTPTRPLEASGTSGEKCVMNGVLQFSVLDGWWVEGYRPSAGWMLPMERTFSEQQAQDELDAEMVYRTIEEQIAPLYYQNRNEEGVPTDWVGYVKSCIADVASNFTTNRMLIDYEERFYNHLAERTAKMAESNYNLARDIAAWKSKVQGAWEHVNVVNVQRVKADSSPLFVGTPYHFEVTLNIGVLDSKDVGVEVIVANQIEQEQSANIVETAQMQLVKEDGNIVTYSLDYVPVNSGSFDMAIRVFPQSEDLVHRVDLPLMKWV